MMPFDSNNSIRFKRILWLVAVGVSMNTAAVAEQEPSSGQTSGTTGPTNDEAGQPAAEGGAVNPEALMRFKRGVLLFDGGNYDGALVEFRRAYDLAPNYRLLYNIAVCHQRLGDDAGAHRTFERYLLEGAEAISEERRDEVEKALQITAKRIGRIAVTSNIADATIMVDDVPMARTPHTDAIVVNAGRRRVSLAVDNRLLGERFVEVVTGEVVDVSLTVDERPQNPTEPPADDVTQPKTVSTDEHVGEAAPAQASSSRLPLWISLAATGAFSIAAGVTGTMALNAHDDHREELRQFPGDPAAIASTEKRARDFALATDILGAAALLGGGASVYFLLQDSKETAELDVRLSPAGATLNGTF